MKGMPLPLFGVLIGILGGPFPPDLGPVHLNVVDVDSIADAEHGGGHSGVKVAPRAMTPSWLRVVEGGFSGMTDCSPSIISATGRRVVRSSRDHKVWCD